MCVCVCADIYIYFSIFKVITVPIYFYDENIALFTGNMYFSQFYFTNYYFRF